MPAVVVSFSRPTPTQPPTTSSLPQVIDYEQLPWLELARTFEDVATDKTFENIRTSMCLHLDVLAMAQRHTIYCYRYLIEGTTWIDDGKTTIATPTLNKWTSRTVDDVLARAAAALPDCGIVRITYNNRAPEEAVVINDSHAITFGVFEHTSDGGRLPRPVRRYFQSRISGKTSATTAAISGAR